MFNVYLCLIYHLSLSVDENKVILFERLPLCNCLTERLKMVTSYEIRILQIAAIFTRVSKHVTLSPDMVKLR